MIYTFYSYKGGVGRTMALANIAEMFYQDGMKVLMVDWDLEAPGLERFFPLDQDEILEKRGIIDMLLDYKKQMTHEPPNIKNKKDLPFETPDSLIIDIYPNTTQEGKLWLITAGRRSKDNFAEYANKILNFDWYDFYKNWEGELYLDWIREQFERIADVVLIDSRTGVTEMGGISTYQLADTVVMLCSANQQCLHGTYEMAQNFKGPKVEKLRGERPLNVLIIPARIERAESALLNKFQKDFVKLFKDSVQPIEEIDIWTLWKAGIPYIPKYAFTEALAVREKGRASAEDMVEAFNRLNRVMKHLDSVQIEKVAPKKVPEKMTMLRIFVASPGDVSEERERLKEVINEINHGIAESKGLILQYVGWETHAWSGMGEVPQNVINKQIGPYDIFIGIMWKRFGTPTKRAGSGTEEELEQAYRLWSEYGKPHIMLYFNKTPFFSSSVDETEQMAKVFNFKKKAREKDAPYWEYNGPEEFEKFVRQHLTKGILKWGDYVSPISPPPIVRLPLDFYHALFNELDMYITQFDQLRKDYKRELKGELLQFAVDFSEIHNYMYPYKADSPRSSLNQYIFNTIENPLTLMPGAVGELLTDLERALPPPDVLEQDPISIYKDVAVFINSFFSVINDEEEIVRLYSRAERQLKKAWRELFNLVIQDERHTPLYAVKSLIDRGKLTPINGVREITNFPLEVKQRAQSVRNYLDFERPGRIRNNQVDTIDFAVTWLLNAQKQDIKNRYFSIYTQSQYFINACTTSHNLRWEDDYLVRGA